jgi:DNA-binding transcriptional ArsR family regulator
MAQTPDRLRRLLTDELGECCEEDVTQRLDELDTLAQDAATTDLQTDVQALSALSSETRYRLVRLLVTADDDLCVCEFAPLFDVSESAISHALSMLTDAGLVSRRRDGKWRYYRSTERADRLLTALETTRGGDR